MWWRSRSGPAQERLRNRVSALEERCSALEVELRTVKLEAENVYSSAFKLHEQVRKRQQKKVTEATAEPTENGSDSLDINERIKRGMPV